MTRSLFFFFCSSTSKKPSTFSCSFTICASSSSTTSLRMVNSVKMVRRYASRNPPEIQYELQLHWYNQFKAADEGQDLYRPIPEQELRKQLLSKNDENNLV
jgi:hypothetical protein